MGTFLILGCIGAATAISVAAMNGAKLVPGQNQRPSPHNQVRSHKLASLQVGGDSQVHAKPHAAIIVETRLDKERSEPLRGTWAIRGKIVASEAAERIDFKWVLPEGSRILEGASESSLSGFAEGDSREVSLTVQVPKSSEAPRVVLAANKGFDEYKVGNASAILLEEIDSQAADRNWLLKSELVESSAEGHGHAGGVATTQATGDRYDRKPANRKKVRIFH